MQLKMLNSLSEICAIKMIRDPVSFVKALSKAGSYIEFKPSMLPKGISRNKLIKHFEFLSPIVLILHGSTISGKKFSEKKDSDLDIVCVSLKAIFWPLEQLYKKMNENLERENTKIDVSIITSNEFLSIKEVGSSLNKSLDHGFSILYKRGKNELH